jgi:tRNA(Ile)-lysidine synthase
MVLLHILHRLSAGLGIRLVALHVNHGLRGAESDADEEFVRESAASLGVDILVARGPVNTGNLEQEARQVRRDFFRHAMAEHRLSRVALGQTRSDQAETVLFRLLRGSGLAGLAGMRMVTQDGIIRPLLITSRAEVRQWAAEEGIEWREDSSNLDLHFARNRLRNQIFPVLASEFNSNLEGVLAAVAELAQSEEDYWFQQIDSIYRGLVRRTHFGHLLPVDALLALHLAARRRVIRRAILDVKGDLRSIGFEHIEAVLRICTSHAGHDRVIIPGIDALRSFDQLLLTRPGELNVAPRHYRVGLQIGVECKLPFQAGTIFVHWANHENKNCVNVKEGQEFKEEVADLDPQVATGGNDPGFLYVRNWEPGDELHRPGHERAEKIKSLFQEQRVLLWERRHWPVVVAGGEIIWVRSFGSAAKSRASGESRRVLRLVFRRNPE